MSNEQAKTLSEIIKDLSIWKEVIIALGLWVSYKILNDLIYKVKMFAMFKIELKQNTKRLFEIKYNLESYNLTHYRNEQNKIYIFFTEDNKCKKNVFNKLYDNGDIYDLFVLDDIYLITNMYDTINYSINELIFLGEQYKLHFEITKTNGDIKLIPVETIEEVTIKQIERLTRIETDLEQVIKDIKLKHWYYSLVHFFIGWIFRDKGKKIELDSIKEENQEKSKTPVK